MIMLHHVVHVFLLLLFYVQTSFLSLWFYLLRNDPLKLVPAEDMFHRTIYNHHQTLAHFFIETSLLSFSIGCSLESLLEYRLNMLVYAYNSQERFSNVFQNVSK